GSSHEGCYSASSEYFSTLITKYAGKQLLFVQSIEDECNLDQLDVYNESVKLYYNKDTTFNKIWKTINIHKKYDRIKVSDPSSDRDNLAKLFESGMLLVMEKKSQLNNENKKVWESLQKALEANKRGINRKVGILSIIAKNFTYKKLNKKFGIKLKIIFIEFIIK
ncbi:hypothetical protein RhiirA4_489339, partial [Rhizophagus irregularis]